MDRQPPHVIAARQARPAHRRGDPLVERAALLPEAVVPLVFPFREVRALVVEVVAGFRQNGNALFREFAQAVHGAREEVGVVDHLVVVEEHHGVEAERVRHYESQVAHGAVAGKPHFSFQLADVELLHALAYERQFDVAHDQHVELGVCGGDLAHLLGGLVLDARVGGYEHHDEPQPVDLLERREATVEFALLGDGCCVVVACHDVLIVAASAGCCDKRRNDDDRVHAVPFIPRRARREGGCAGRCEALLLGAHRRLLFVCRCGLFGRRAPPRAREAVRCNVRATGCMLRGAVRKLL